MYRDKNEAYLKASMTGNWGGSDIMTSHLYDNCYIVFYLVI